MEGKGVEGQKLIIFGIMGPILTMVGAAIRAFTGHDGMSWALFGSEIAIIWMSFLRTLGREQNSLLKAEPPLLKVLAK